MTDLASLKNQSPVLALLLLVITGGSVNYLSEGSEEEVMEQFVQELRAADIKQDDRHDDLLQMVNDLRTQVALLEQIID